MSIVRGPLDILAPNGYTTPCGWHTTVLIRPTMCIDGCMYAWIVNGTVMPVTTRPPPALPQQCCSGISWKGQFGSFAKMSTGGGFVVVITGHYSTPTRTIQTRTATKPQIDATIMNNWVDPNRITDFLWTYNSTQLVSTFIISMQLHLHTKLLTTAACHPPKEWANANTCYQCRKFTS